VNGLAAAVAEKLIAPGPSQRRWQRRVHRWLAQEGPWLRRALGRLEGLEPLPSATNFLLVRGVTGDGAPRSLQALRQRLEQRHRILLRDCRSFEGLDDSWLRIGLQDRRRHRQLLRALELAQASTVC
jgi:histidinol-phosphate/aromatic aminotransferase/cobyric acid decarboxylase-like protein